VTRFHLKMAGLLSAAALAVGGHVAVAQTADSAAVAELQALDKAWIDAEVRRDQAALERILDEGFLATFTSGATINRSAFIARIMGSNIEPFEVIHEAIRVHGDVAVVIDTSMDRKMKYSWIAIKREGQWRVISETFTKVQGT